MKCPLMAEKLIQEGIYTVPERAECIGTDCAWWISDINMCSMRAAGLELRYVQQRLGDLVDILKRGGNP